MIPRDFDQSKYLTGLRAYACLAVFLIHAKGMMTIEASGALGRFYKNLVAFGKYGVIIFFVLSAYTIAISINKSDNFSFKPYIFRRLFRVLPMYYIMIFVGYLFGGISYYFELFGVVNNLLNLSAHLTFINIFFIEFRNNLLGVEWSIPIELFYYFLFPPIYLVLIKKYRWHGLIFLLSLSVSFIGPKFIAVHFFNSNNDLAYHWSLFKYAFSFMVGLLTFEVSKIIPLNKTFTNDLTLMGLLFTLVSYIFSGIGQHEEFFAIWTAFLILTIRGQTPLCRFLFESKLVLFVGAISYSFYLVHFIVLEKVSQFFTSQMMISFFALMISILVSYLTFVFVERPFIKLGHNFTNKI